MGRRLVALFILTAALVVVAAPPAASAPDRVDGADPVGTGAAAPDAREGAAGSGAGAVPAVPSYPGDFPDPFILLDGKTYWAYSTGSGGRDLQVMWSRDLQRWSAPKEALAGLPPWGSRGLTWAPEVVPIGDRFVMYYTLRETASGRQCISVATARRPGGPFSDSSEGPLVCQAEHSGSIDPSPFTVGQTRYLLWKSDDNAAGQPTHLWGRQLAADGLSWAGPSEQLLLDQTEDWQDGIIEGPSMIASDGIYYLFYGAGAWSSAAAGIGYATCTAPLGPCTNVTTSGAWLGSRPGASGPSGPATIRDLTGATRFAYHAWPDQVGYENGGVRALYVDRLSFVGGSPVLG